MALEGVGVDGTAWEEAKDGLDIDPGAIDGGSEGEHIVIRKTKPYDQGVDFSVLKSTQIA